MSYTFEQILTALTTFPGNLAYHMILAFSVAAALQAAIHLWRMNKFPQGLRMVIGLGILLGFRIFLFIGAGIIQQDAANAHALLPILDRTAAVLSLIVMIWLWNFPEPMQTADAASGLLGLLSLTASILSWAWWRQNYPDMAFNASWLDLGWGIYALALTLFGAVALLLRRPNGWGHGLGMLIIISLGYGLHLGIPNLESDFSWSVRLAQMVAYPLLFTLPRRFQETVPVTPEKKSPRITEPPPVLQERRRYGIQPERAEALLAIIAESSPDKLCKAITRTIGETMLADICLLIYPPRDNQGIQLQCGYDLIREEEVPTQFIDQNKLPLLMTAMRQVRPLRLPASSTSRDLFNLGQFLDIGSTGHLLASTVPATKENQEPLFGIVLLSPHSNRRWSREDQQVLEDITHNLAPIFQRAKNLAGIQEELANTKENLKTFQDLFEEQQAENQAIKEESSRLEAKLNTVKRETLQEEQQAELARLQENYEKAENTIQRLQVENLRLGEMVEDLLAQNQGAASSREEQLGQELQMALQEITILKQELELVDDQQLIPEQKTPPLSKEDHVAYRSMSQELRQPLASILGYTELLLGESTGILGALQRKFLERVQTSAQRMKARLDDLSQIIALDSERLALNPETVNLGDVIDKAIAETSKQLRQKKISLRVDLPDKMPQIHADRDALQQILLHLLENAGAVSPQQGEIFLRAAINDEQEQDFILVQVADQGGGIPQEDLPRVFSRLYNADNVPIEGVGETGVGLSMVKTLTEAHDGRVWIDTDMGTGSTFNILLPLDNQLASPLEIEES